MMERGTKLAERGAELEEIRGMLLVEKRNLQMGALQLQQTREGRLQREAGNFYGLSRWSENYRQEEIWSLLQQEAFLREMQCRFGRNSSRTCGIDRQSARQGSRLSRRMGRNASYQGGIIIRKRQRRSPLATAAVQEGLDLGALHHAQLMIRLIPMPVAIPVIMPIAIATAIATHISL